MAGAGAATAAQPHVDGGDNSPILAFPSWGIENTAA